MEHLQRLRRHLGEPVDITSLVALRVLFGAVMLAGTVRFWQAGWIDVQYGAPRFFFKYLGFEWVELPPWGLQAHFAVVGVAALCVTLGFLYRAAIVTFTLSFAWVQLLDVTNYLNHYYLVVLLGGILALLPLGSRWSLDALVWPARRRDSIARAGLYLVRFQIGVVYVFAALAKLNSDWLLAGRPLGLWLASRDELPLIGAVIALPWMAHVMSWAGFLYDATIVGWLSRRRTRPWAYVVVLLFHAATFVFFEIGMFPFIMSAVTTVFFAPDWPRRLVGRFAPRAALPAAVTSGRPLGALTLAALLTYGSVQVLVPLRTFVYGGDVLWHEQGMRFSWRVLVREKSGSVTYRVRSPARQRTWIVSPSEYLTHRQAHEMSGQPDLILQLAHAIHADFRARGIDDAEVYADTHVSLNGRPARPLIDPRRDLARVADGVARADWILAREPDVSGRAGLLPPMEQ